MTFNKQVTIRLQANSRQHRKWDWHPKILFYIKREAIALMTPTLLHSCYIWNYCTCSTYNTHKSLFLNESSSISIIIICNKYIYYNCIIIAYSPWNIQSFSDAISADMPKRKNDLKFYRKAYKCGRSKWPVR